MNRSQLMKILLAGGGLGFLGAVGIYFDPAEPYPGFITAAGTLGGLTIALLIAAVVTAQTSLPVSLIWGAAMGLLTSATTFLAKGGWTSWDAPYIVPTCVVTGLILAPIVRLILRRTSET